MENSEILLRQALQILQASDVPQNQWVVGGGTVLSRYLNHRLSKDIDVFIDDIQLLSSLSPRFNDESSDALYYTEEGRYISFTFPTGKIDFIASPRLTDFEPRKQLFFGHKIWLEHPVEIVSKKLFFRGELAIPRDVFDLAAVYNSQERQNLIHALLGMPEKVDAFYYGLLEQMRNEKYVPYSKESRDMILPCGEAIMDKEIQLCRALLCRINMKYDFRSQSGSLEK